MRKRWQFIQTIEALDKQWLMTMPFFQRKWYVFMTYWFVVFGKNEPEIKYR